jgi:hypothetical protein
MTICGKMNKKISVIQKQLKGGKKLKKEINGLILLLTTILIVGCANVEDASTTDKKTDPKVAATENTDVKSEKEDATEVADEPEKKEPEVEESVAKETSIEPNDNLFPGYNLLEVDGGDLFGYRQPNVVVDIGFRDREYWAFTQLVRVIADEIILQDDRTEPVTSSGRYYSDEAKVPGVESDILDEGHIITDSLGGVSNANNITPQDSTLNRLGDQAYLDRSIRDAGGATNFEAIITYPDTETQIPSSYQYTYTLMGNVIVDTFDNANPDEVNESLGLTEGQKPDSTSSNTDGDLSSVDTDGNGLVTIKEAKAAGFSMPITSDHSLYPHMRDNDGDGMVGE